MNTQWTIIVLCLTLHLCNASPYPEMNNNLLTVTSHNTVVLRGPVDDSSVSDIILKLHQIKENNIYLILNTPGGSVVSGYHLIQTIDAFHKDGVKVICIANVALSMGFVILQSCPVRYIMPSSIIMQHQMAFGIIGPIERVKNYVNFVDNIETKINMRQANRLGLTLEDFKYRIINDWWIFGEQAIVNDMADEMIYLLCEHDMLNKTTIETRYTMFGPIEIEFYQCPLISKPKSIRWSNYLTNDKQNLVLSMFDSDKMVFEYDKIRNFLQ